MGYKCEICGKNYCHETQYDKHVIICKMKNGYFGAGGSAKPETMSHADLCRMNMYLFQEVISLKNELAILKRTYKPSTRKADIINYLNDNYSCNIEFDEFIKTDIVVDDDCIGSLLDGGVKKMIDLIIQNTFSPNTDEEDKYSIPLLYVKETNSIYINTRVIVSDSEDKLETETETSTETTLDMEDGPHYTWVKIARNDKRLSTIQLHIQKKVFKMYMEWRGKNPSLSATASMESLKKVTSLAKSAATLKHIKVALVQHALVSMAD